MTSVILLYLNNTNKFACSMWLWEQILLFTCMICCRSGYLEVSFATSDNSDHLAVMIACCTVQARAGLNGV
jgi:hypothetical protein